MKVSLKVPDDRRLCFQLRYIRNVYKDSWTDQFQSNLVGNPKTDVLMTIEGRFLKAKLTKIVCYVQTDKLNTRYKDQRIYTFIFR